MAIDGTYTISVDLGNRKETGTAVIASRGSRVRLTLKAPVIGTVKAEGTAGPNDTFEVSGKLRILLKRITYTVKGGVKGDELDAVCTTNIGTVNVKGKRTS